MWMQRRIASIGFSGKSCGIFFQRSLKLFWSGSTQLPPFSTSAILSVGKRVSAPCTISDATASSIGRHDESMRNAFGWNGRNSELLPIHSLANRS
jgi:hypothetical protein